MLEVKRLCFRELVNWSNDNYKKRLHNFVIRECSFAWLIGCLIWSNWNCVAAAIAFYQRPLLRNDSRIVISRYRLVQLQCISVLALSLDSAFSSVFFCGHFQSISWRVCLWSSELRSIFAWLFMLHNVIIQQLMQTRLICFNWINSKIRCSWDCAMLILRSLVNTSMMYRNACSL